MSHWKKFESAVLNNVKRNLLDTAVAEMGLQLDYNVKSVSNSYGKAAVDAGFKKNGKVVSVGLVFTMNKDKTEAIRLEGDFYATGLNESTFMDKLSQVYQKHNIINKVEREGWTIEKDTLKVDAQGNIEFDIYQYA
jgi:hypothetical protein